VVLNRNLAVRLLTQVMGWDASTVAQELGLMNALATYKYDHYLNFEPGLRFVEALACWLGQFDEEAERQAAYDFVKNRLLFISEREMHHLVQLCYPDVVAPTIRRQVAETYQPSKQAYKISAKSPQFVSRLRRSAFLGLSDGARMDEFRRANRNISHEQVYVSYELSRDRLQSMTAKLEGWVKQHAPDETAKWANFFLMDDFAGSGRSLIRDEGRAGKLNVFAQLLEEWEDFLDTSQLRVFVIVYVMTEQAKDHVETLIPALPVQIELLPVCIIPDSVKVTPDTDPAFDELLQKYYDSSLEDIHTQVGGTDMVYGFAGCALPLVLNHNTPNNSVYLLWAETEERRPLFYRVTRHKAND